MYHRVLTAERACELAVEPGMFVTPDTFTKHLDWLRDAFNVLSLGEITNRLEARRPLPEHACAITFDDGWRDNWEFAYPALRRCGLPATIFLVAGRVGTQGAFWPDEICRRYRALEGPKRRALAAKFGLEKSRVPEQATIALFKKMDPYERNDSLARFRNLSSCVDLSDERELANWDEIAEMAGGGVEFESHGLSHALMTGIPRETLEKELRESRRILKERGYGQRGLLAYPNGDQDAGVRGCLRECGYRAAVTTQRGLASANSDLLLLPRLGLHQDVAASRPAFNGMIPGSAFR
jgi:peptidoglycan/xylan/chitin deacetylase (PgdA/CDA1 family)